MVKTCTTTSQSSLTAKAALLVALKIIMTTTSPQTSLSAKTAVLSGTGDHVKTCTTSPQTCRVGLEIMVKACTTSPQT